MDVFILSREWRDTGRGIEIVLWAKGPDMPVRACLTGQEAVMFVLRGMPATADRRIARELRTLDGDSVDALYFRSQRALVEERKRIRARHGRAFESDIKPHERFLMERFITASARLQGEARIEDGVLHFENPKVKAVDITPTLSALSLDIETDGFDGPLLSAAVSMGGHERVFVRGTGVSHGYVTFAPDERSLLAALFGEIRALDPDLLVGWNVVAFDLTVLEARSRLHRLPFAIGRAGEAARVLPPSSSKQLAMARVPGRVVLDGIDTLKSATHRFERFTLEHVARELLGRGKAMAPGADPEAEIRRMHVEDPLALAAYNLEDCRLVLRIFERVDLVGFAMERARLTGLAMDRPGGSVAAFDHLYLPRLHRKGFVAPDVDGEVDVIPSPGGHVLDSVPGLFTNVLSFDFRSLYPSIIRTFLIDPLGLHQPGTNPIAGEDGATFARDGAILPELIETLHEARSLALAQKNEALSRAIKILMNSFYGVLGTPGCRFFDSRLPTSITRRGHSIIERARLFFVSRGLTVLYGDTDSLFVHLDEEVTEAEAEERGSLLARELTETMAAEIQRDFGVESRLELRFESHYLQFLMPRTRGTERGSKKRYAGAVRGGDGALSIVVRGLEAVRTDWTPLARRVQRELLRRVFSNEPFEGWLFATAQDLQRGRLNQELIYRKRLRHPLGDYASAGAPPHVRAARKREAERPNLAEVEYVMTLRGPEPLGELRSPMDYAHYLDKQLAPACDVILPFMGTTFEEIAGAQANLFRRIRGDEP